MSSDDTMGDVALRADAVAAAVLGVAGVHSRHGGAFGEVATYLPGRRVTGVRLHERGCDLHVVLAYGAAVADVVSGVRAAVRPLVSGTIDVTIEDVAPPGAPSPVADHPDS